MTSAIILAGGSGTRLWPLSSAERPKQFLTLLSEKSMLRETSERLEPIIPQNMQYVLTGKKYVPLVKEEFGDTVRVLAEPIARNTAPCILWAIFFIKKMQGSGVCAVVPSDHTIKNADAFQKALAAAVDKASEGAIVTFGINPTRAETGYGYIEIETKDFALNQSLEKLVTFHEKPNAELAERYLKEGRYLWNSGMFVFDIDTMIDEFRVHAPELYDVFISVDPTDPKQVSKAFENVQPISIDYAVMEKTDKAFCIPSAFGWSDVGGYASLHEETKKDDDGNAVMGNAVLSGTHGCYIQCEKQVVAIGLNDLIIIENDNMIFVADKRMSKEIGQIAKQWEKGRGK